MKHIGLIILAWLIPNLAGQDIYVCKNAVITLYSKAPIEDIDARTDRGTSVFNATTGELAFSVPIRSFKFDKALMQEHFNENYLESDKYPQAVFKGKITGTTDLSKDGSYSISVTGVLDVHGVKQTRTIPGKITVTGGTVSMAAEFMVACKDHNIEIPTLVFHNIAESIRIQVSANYSPYKATP
ncbi:YceI family protein [Inquilinus sp. KBS0705]|nr:YceI family protein [Inquilinus sp. KBS0705]